jgi:hypothetical protein
MYIDLAKSLLEGKGLEFQGEVFLKTPPGFPFLLAGILAVFGTNPWVLQGLAIFCAIGTMVLGGILAWKVTGKSAIGWFVVILTGCNYVFWTYSRFILTDMPFAFLAIGSVFSAEAAARLWKTKDAEKSKKAWLLWLLACLLSAVVTLIHVRGLAIVAALLVGAFTRKSIGGAGLRLKCAAVLIVVFAVPFFTWKSYSARFGNSESYLKEISWRSHYDRDKGRVGVLRIFARPFIRLPKELQSVGCMMLNIRSRSELYYSRNIGVDKDDTFRRIRIWFAGVLAITVVLGLLIRLIDERSFAAWYLGGYMYMIMLRQFLGGYPIAVLPRYLLPVLPLFFMFGYIGLNAVGKWAHSVWIGKIPKVNWPFIGTVMLVFISIVAAHRGAEKITPRLFDEHSPKTNHPAYRSTKPDIWDAVGLVENHVPKDAVIVCKKATLIYFLTGRNSVAFYKGRRWEKQWRGLRQADYVLTDKNRKEVIKYLLPAIEEHPEHFVKIDKKNKYTLWKILKDKAEQPDKRKS